jgi:hypothetical protein
LFLGKLSNLKNIMTWEQLAEKIATMPSDQKRRGVPLIASDFLAYWGRPLPGHKSIAARSAARGTILPHSGQLFSIPRIS